MNKIRLILTQQKLFLCCHPLSGMSGRRYYLCFIAGETKDKLDKLPKGVRAVS